MTTRLILQRETLRQLNAQDLATVQAGGANTAGCPPTATACGSNTACAMGTCGTQTIKTSITGGVPTRTISGG